MIIVVLDAPVPTEKGWYIYARHDFPTGMNLWFVSDTDVGQPWMNKAYWSRKIKIVPVEPPKK